MRDECRYFARHQTDRGLDTSEKDFLNCPLHRSGTDSGDSRGLVTLCIIGRLPSIAQSAIGIEDLRRQRDRVAFLGDGKDRCTAQGRTV